MTGERTRNTESESADGLPAPDETGALGLRQLKRFHYRTIAGANGPKFQTTNAEWVHDKIVLYGLGLSLAETLKFLFNRQPSFEQFEAYVLQKNGGEIETSLIERINATLAGDEPPREAAAEFAAIDALPPVLNDVEIDFWHEHGYVVVREAITREEAAAAEVSVWDFLGASPSARDSWYDRGLKEGIWVKAFDLEASRRIRRSPRIRKAFSQLWGTSDLWPTIDSVGFNPPEVPGKYSFPGPNLHWDMSLAPPFEFGTQGVLYLNDVTENQGAFTCVPGFHHRLEKWLDELPVGSDPRAVDLAGLGPRPIAANAGDLIIWHQSLPHGSSPNRAEFPRVVQYINMFPNRCDDSDDWK